ncbi:MAG: hypothetical protein AAFX50_06790 [Acidobacteriota bacterium]
MGKNTEETTGQAKVLLVGLESSAVDFDKWPGLTEEGLHAAAGLVRSKLVAEGFGVHWCLTGTGPEARGQLREALETVAPDIVSIGAGVRADPAHLRLFEDFVNWIHRRAPDAVFAFNTDPLDTVESVKRAARRLRGDRG